MVAESKPALPPRTGPELAEAVERHLGPEDFARLREHLQRPAFIAGYRAIDVNGGDWNFAIPKPGDDDAFDYWWGDQ